MIKRFYIPFLYIVTVIVGIGYGLKWFGLYDLSKEQNALLLINFSRDRPFVFRVFIPFLARILTDLLAIPPDYAILITIIISFVGMLWALQYLGLAYSDNHERIALFAFGGVLASSFLLSSGFGEIYDPATVFFFALSLGLLARNKLKEYYFLFLFATLNRETTFLLVMVYVFYYYRRIPLFDYISGIAYQTLVYISIKFIVSYLFADNGGKPMYLLEYDVFRVYISNPLLTTGMIVILLACLYYVFKGWKNKPLFLRVAFLSIFPAQVLLHFLLGYAYELRVFLESIPVICMLYMFNGKEFQSPSRRNIPLH